MVMALEVRLLAGFTVHCGSRPVVGFESQKVRGLLAYLLLNRDTSPSRERVAGLLWPNQSTATSRKNLRQALFNLRTTLQQGCNAPVPEPFHAYHESIELNPAFPWQVDVTEFEASAHAGLRQNKPDRLLAAAQLYRGDLLAGFFVRDSSPFESWLLAEQERLRELSMQVLRQLLVYQSAQPDRTPAILTALRLLDLDPLAEDVHRELMQLYAAAGRRSAALKQYRALESLLITQLGVTPAPVTRELHERLRCGEQTAVEPQSNAVATSMMPLVGREQALAALERSWRCSRLRGARVALLAGEAGVGKTRLARLLLRRLVAEQHAVLVQSRLKPPVRSMQGVSDLLADAWRLAAPADRERIEARRPQLLDQLEPLIPQLRPPAPGARPDAAPRSRSQLLALASELLRELYPSLRGERSGDPVIVLIEDLHWADAGTHELLAELVESFEDKPFWLLVTQRTDDLPRPGAATLQQLRQAGKLDDVTLERLLPGDLTRLAHELFGSSEEAKVSQFLADHTEGLPLAVSEVLHALRDTGLRVPGKGGNWRLTGDLGSLPLPDGDLDLLVNWRVERLENSFRRIVRAAAVIGARFDGPLLVEVAQEHEGVVTLALEQLVAHGFVRPSSRDGLDGGTDSLDRAERAPSFEFAHERVRRAIYRSLPRERQREIHRKVASALERWPVVGPAVEIVAYHLLAANAPQAQPYVEAAVRQARALGADDVAAKIEQTAASSRLTPTMPRLLA